MRWTNARARLVGRTMVLAVAGLPLVLTTTSPADAHAVVRGTDPEDGARLALAPGRVTVFLEAKLPTVEGDPLQVYDPDGVRIDAGDTHVVEPDAGDPGGPAAALSVGLRTDVRHPDGDYQVVYRVISADTHLVAGRFTFRCEGDDGGSAPDPLPGAPGVPGQPRPAAVHAPGPGPSPLAQGWPADRWHWPKTAFLGGLATAVLGALVPRRRSDAVPSVGWTVGMPGLVAGRRLD